MAFRSRRKKRRHEPRRLADVLASVYPSSEPDDVRAIRAFAWWERAVPPLVLANARPVRFRQGVLWIHAANNVWAHELEYLRSDLLHRVQRAAPQSGVRALKIRVGPLPDPPRAPESTRRPLPRVPVRELPEGLARALAAVKDDELRDAVSNAARTGLADER